jgi:putrescine transport system ATP-binding protein
MGEVSEIGYLGDHSIYKIRLDGGFVMKVAVANRTRLVERPVNVGDRVWLTWAANSSVVLTR